MMVNYYGRRGDKHRAREMFEKMRSRGIVPTSYDYTKLVSPYKMRFQFIAVRHYQTCCHAGT